jgi:hypothetical protein
VRRAFDAASAITCGFISNVFHACIVIASSPHLWLPAGANPIIEPHLHKFCGIRNGIDMDIWDPENNRFLNFSITPERVADGKLRARQEMRQRLGLHVSVSCLCIKCTNSCRHALDDVSA